MQGICLTQEYDADIVVNRNALGQITQGLVIGETIYQNEALILLSHQGEFKEDPLLGVGIEDIINDNDIHQWEHSIRVNLTRDNMDVRTARIDRNNGNITIEATYNR